MLSTWRREAYDKVYHSYEELRKDSTGLKIFYRYARMLRDTFDCTLNEYKNLMNYGVTNFRPMSLEERLKLTLKCENETHLF
jgi:hypothetical protein